MMHYSFTVGLLLCIIPNIKAQESGEIDKKVFLDTIDRDSIQGFQIRALRGQKAIHLQWEYPDRAGVQKFIILRSKGKGSMNIYKIASPENLLMLQLNKKRNHFLAYSYIDWNIQMNKDYHYQVLARYKDGKPSSLSAIESTRIYKMRHYVKDQ